MLAPADREIIALSYDRDLSSKEIMAIMQKPSVTAVTTHLHKAMKKLRALVLALESTVEQEDRRAVALNRGADVICAAKRTPPVHAGSRKAALI